MGQIVLSEVSFLLLLWPLLRTFTKPKRKLKLKKTSILKTIQENNLGIV